MENASKALIIAGAILLAILLISLGILIYNQAQDTVSNSGMDQAAISAFNNKFLKYEGTSQSGSVVKSLINEVIASNSDSSTPAIKIMLGDNNAATSGTDISNATSSIETSANYTVRMTKYGNDGCISEIVVSKNTK